MNILQTRVEMQNALRTFVGDLIVNQKLPAYLVEDALQVCLLDVKEASHNELMQAILDEQTEKETEEKENKTPKQEVKDGK